MQNSELSVRVSKGIVEVLQLDDPAMRVFAGEPITCKRATPRGNEVEITGTPEQLKELAAACHNRGWGGGWDQPVWYVRSARAAHRHITRALKSLLVDEEADKRTVVRVENEATHNALVGELSNAYMRGWHHAASGGNKPTDMVEGSAFALGYENGSIARDAAKELAQLVAERILGS